MQIRSISEIIESTPDFKRSYQTAKYTGFVGTACLIISILLIVYQFTYGDTKTNLIIWAVLLIASIFLSYLSRKMMRTILLKAERIKAMEMNQALQRQGGLQE